MKTKKQNETRKGETMTTSNQALKAAAASLRMSRNPVARAARKYDVSKQSVRDARKLIIERREQKQALGHGWRPVRVEPNRILRELRRRQFVNAELQRKKHQADLLLWWSTQKGVTTSLRRRVAIYVQALNSLDEQDLIDVTRRCIVQAVAHYLCYRGRRSARWQQYHRSNHGQSIYLMQGDVRLRLSDHQLGFADYGSRQQSHQGPEVVFDGDETWTNAMRRVLSETKEKV